MDFSFIVMALSIAMPFVILGATISYQRRRDHNIRLAMLMSRIGMENPEQNKIKNELANKIGKTGSDWLMVQLKKAGIVKKKEITRLVVLQVVALLVSLLALILFYDGVSENVMILLVILPFLPSIYVYFKVKKRQKELKNQFPEMLDSIVRSLQSGYGIDGALSAIGEDMHGPLAEEIALVNKQRALGINMREILLDFKHRVDLQEAHFFVITLIIQRETGGQLAAILGELSKLMRRRVLFQGKLKTLTGEARFTAWFIGGAPVLYIAYKYFFDRGSLDFFLYDETGFMLFTISLALIATGTVILNKMLKMRF